MRRVHVIGGPGSGKTTLAGQLGVRLSIPPTDLDEIGYVAGAKRSLSERRADVQAIAARPTWITEGIYLWWVDDLLCSADAIVWLDVPWRVVAHRIVLRHLRASLARTNRHSGVRKLLRFLQSSRNYYLNVSSPEMGVAPDDDGAVTRTRTARELAAHAKKVVRCAASADIAAFLRGWSGTAVS